MIDLAPNNPYALTIASPVIAAAGSLGYGVEVARHLGLAARPSAHGLGALITRSTGLRARKARPLPEIVETPAGLLYRGWDHSLGMRAVRERLAPAWATWDLPVVVSIWGESAAAAAEAAAQLEGVEGVAGVELPLAAHDALTPEAAGRLVAAVRRATVLPLIVKLPGQAADILALARAAVERGADTLSLIDGIPALAQRADGTLADGLLCGPAVGPLALGLVAAVCAEATVPVIGIGGVRDAAGARAMLAAGAAAVGLGSALLTDLRAAARVAAALA
ncbi:dihydroorotate dehydrogenase [Oscillochloris sp. ZM17-4]|uniref:dihydroorotate dehydrogenase n=1 Tax=Oscillochloris sp. ZM17-4 TaxID=2866714 RepID=UPI001C733A40|nr:dihydroorotate dehydrogenase [Oscillochloris sp. ZM17-4]MBX0327255.1 dihydroorotate dehydrogenase [Oscillochloris sp. ZM17-4]